MRLLTDDYYEAVKDYLHPTYIVLLTIIGVETYRFATLSRL